MDPLTAFSLAGTVVSFISFGGEFASLVWKIHKGDCNSADAFIKWNEAIQRSLAVSNAAISSQEEYSRTDLCNLVKDSEKLNVDLYKVLQRSGLLAAGRNHGKLKAVLTALKQSANSSYLKEVRDNLRDLQDRLTLYLLTSLLDFAKQTHSKQKEIIQAVNPSYRTDGSLESSVPAILEALTSQTNFDDGWRQNLRHDMLEIFYSERRDHQSGAASDIVLLPENRQRLERVFLKALTYRGMEDRQERIAATFRKTFEWSLAENNSDQSEWDSIPDWLRSQGQIYWLSGKAGSGKSTLMKYLSGGDLWPTEQSHKPPHMPRCDPFLREWAGNNDLVIASFYFWATNPNKVQTSMNSLLRTLLYRIFGSRPETIPAIASSRWEALSLMGSHRQLTVWGDKELLDCLNRVVIKLTGEGSYVAFFIDGLDEFDGTTEELIGLVQQLASIHPRVKLCVASRPWVEFQDAFHSKPNLMLEHLNYNDIKEFVTERFHDHPDFARLQARRPEYAETLMENVIEKASGVFLWVTLVVASLLAGMGYGDGIEDLQRHLDSLPSDLRDLYKRMLAGLDPFYHTHAAKMIRLIDSAEQALSLTTFSFADEENTMTLQNLPETQNASMLELREEDMRRRINSRWKGLIEVTYTYPSGRRRAGQRPRTTAVGYIHKTVRDFIASEDVQSFLEASLKNATFDPELQLSIGYCALLKTGLASDRYAAQKSFAFHARKISAGNEADTIQIVEVLLKSTAQRSDVLEWAVRHGLTLVVKMKLQHCQDIHLLDKLLRVAISDENDDLYEKIVEFLLQQGANPNTQWRNLLASINSANYLSSLGSSERLSVIAFVNYGASVEDARARYIMSYRNKYGSREVSRSTKFSDEFFNELKAIVPVRKQPTKHRVLGWLDRNLISNA